MQSTSAGRYGRNADARVRPILLAIDGARPADDAEQARNKALTASSRRCSATPPTRKPFRLFPFPAARQHGNGRRERGDQSEQRRRQPESRPGSTEQDRCGRRCRGEEKQITGIHLTALLHSPEHLDRIFEMALKVFPHRVQHLDKQRIAKRIEHLVPIFRVTTRWLILRIERCCDRLAGSTATCSRMAPTERSPSRNVSTMWDARGVSENLEYSGLEPTKVFEMLRVELSRFRGSGLHYCLHYIRTFEGMQEEHAVHRQIPEYHGHRPLQEMRGETLPAHFATARSGVLPVVARILSRLRIYLTTKDTKSTKGPEYTLLRCSPFVAFVLFVVKISRPSY